MVLHLRRAEHGRVDGGLVEPARPVVAGRTVRPGGEVVAADAPVAGVVLVRGDVQRALRRAVHVEGHSARSLGGDDMVPLVVVVGGRGGDGAGGSGVDAEDQPSVVGHVDVLVVLVAGADLAVPEADELAAAGGVGPEPGLDAVGAADRLPLVPVHVGVRAVEADRGARAGDRAGRLPQGGGVVVDPALVARRGVGDEGQGRFVVAPVQLGPVGADLVRVALRRGRDGHARRRGQGAGVAGPVGGRHAVGVRLARRHGGVGPGGLRPPEEQRVGGDRGDRRGRAVPVDPVGQRAVVEVEAGTPADLGLVRLEAHRTRHGHGGRAGVPGGGEARQALLRRAVDGGELPADPQVLDAALGADGHHPRPDALADAVVGVGGPAELAGAGGGLGEQVVALTVGELADAGAVVRVRGAVEHVLVGQHGLGGAEAGVAPALAEVGEVQGDPAVEDAAARALVAGVEAGGVGRDVLDHGVGLDEAGVRLGECAARRVDDGQGVRVRAVDGEEVAAEDHVVAVRGDLDGTPGLVGVGGEGLQGAVGRADGGEALPRLARDAEEVTARVDGVAGDGEGAHGGREGRAEALLHRAARHVDGGETRDGGAVDGAEVAADVQGPLVR